MSDHINKPEKELLDSLEIATKIIEHLIFLQFMEDGILEASEEVDEIYYVAPTYINENKNDFIRLSINAADYFKRLINTKSET